MVRVEFKLYAGLMKYLPPNADGHVIRLELQPGTTIAEVIGRFSIPRDRVHLVVCNGTILHRDQTTKNELKDGDVLALWPSVAGG